VRKVCPLRLNVSMNFANLIPAILRCLDSGVDVEQLTPQEFVGKLADVLEDSMGGTIGARK
jgi:hypothetical protein